MKNILIGLIVVLALLFGLAFWYFSGAPEVEPEVPTEPIPEGAGLPEGELPAPAEDGPTINAPDDTQIITPEPAPVEDSIFKG